MKYTNKLQNLNMSLTPSKEQEARMRAQVFGQTPEQSNFLQIYSMFQSKQLYAALFGFATFIFILPIGLVLLGVSNMKSNDSLPSPEKTFVAQEPLVDLPGSDREKLDTLESESFGADSQANYVYDEVAAAPSDDFRMFGSVEEDTATQQQNRAVIQDALLTLESRDIRNDYNAIKDLAAKFDGYIVSSSYNGGELDKASIEMRVPANKFQSVLDEIRGMKVEIIFENVEAQDMQNELTELTGIAESLESQIKELEEKLANTEDQAKKDSIQQEINSLQSQQTSNNSELNELTQETSFSTIEVELRESESKGLFSDVFDSTSGTFEFVVTFWINAIIIGLVPFIILALVIRTIAKRMKTTPKDK